MATKARKHSPTPRFRDKRTSLKLAPNSPLLLRLDPQKPLETHKRLSEGLAYKSLSDFVNASQLPLRKVADLIDVPLSTLDRRKKSRKPLKPDESERLYRLAQVFEKAVALFEGDVAAAREWLGSPVRGLGHQVPLELVRTAVGAQMVLDLIGRLEHGVFS